MPKAIRASGADVVGIEEGYATMPKIAKALGWDYYDERTQIVSRFPLLRPADGSQYTYVEVAPGRVVAIANEHLPSWSYGPDHVRNGMPLDKILHVEETLRVPAVKPAIEDLAPLADRRRAVVHHGRLQHAVAPGLDRRCAPRSTGTVPRGLAGG